MTNGQAGFFILMTGILMCLAALMILIWDKTRKYRYTGSVMGTVVSHEWRRMDSGRGLVTYPCAVVEYVAEGKRCQCLQRFTAVCYNSVKHADYDWVLDEKYRLHCYVTRYCINHVDPVRDLFPVGSSMEVYYVPGKPEKAFCGSLQSLSLVWVILGAFGLGTGLFGVLLMTVLA